MKSKKFIVAGAIFIMIAMVYISFVAAGNSNGDTVFTSEDLYRINCAGCHERDRSGNPPHYPSLIDIKGELSKNEVRERIENGDDQMPDFSHLSQNERDAIVAFLFDETTEGVELSRSGMGESIFKSNCSSCHRATTSDPSPPNTYGCMEPAPMAGATKRFSEDEFFNILAKRVCYMPSFGHLTSLERESLYGYIKSLEGKGEPSRPTMGEMCPMVRSAMSGDRANAMNCCMKQ